MPLYKTNLSTIIGVKNFAFSNTASDVGGYDQLLDFSTGSESDLNVSVTNASALIEAFASPLGSPEVNVIPAGMWEFNFYAYASLTGAFTNNVVFTVYKRAAGGSETLLFTATSPNIQVASVTLYTLLFNLATDTTLLPTDRLVIKVNGQTTNVVPTVIHFVFDGATHASIVRTPLAGGAVSVGGNLSGTTAQATVTAIGGASPIAVTPAVLSWAAATAAPTLKQSDLVTNSGVGAALTVQAQNETGTTSTGGALNLTSGTGTTAGGAVTLQVGGTTTVSVDSTTQMTLKPTTTIQNGNAKVTITDVLANVQTTDATVTSLATWTIPNGVSEIDAIFTGLKSDGTQVASFKRSATFRNNAGTVGQLGTTTDNGTQADDGTWAATLDFNGTTGRARVTGKAATTIQWHLSLRRQEGIS